ncbi:hypothetical protein ACGE24_06330 [Corynebacterium kroppenstedtii]|uniref:hypothetical protein n=1 Tax=Corynebacterium sp. PCR 32 TaxID=3351342 RepID=UPI0030AEE8F8
MRGSRIITLAGSTHAGRHDPESPAWGRAGMYTSMGATTVMKLLGNIVETFVM